MNAQSSAVAAAYWEKRAREFGSQGRGLAAVCSYGMPAFYNHYIESCQRRALLPVLPRISLGMGAALDIGCGVGRWSLELAARGHEVTGIDLSPHMIDLARARAAQEGATCSFSAADVISLQLGQSFDLILCVTVLQHILDPAQAQAAIQRLAAHLAPGGQLILLEAAPTRSSTRCDTGVFRARPLDWYLGALQAAGLSVVAQRGVDPMPFKTWLLPHYRRVAAPLGNVALALATAVAFPLDWIFGRWLSRSSWHKVLVARHTREVAP